NVFVQSVVDGSSVLLTANNLNGGTQDFGAKSPIFSPDDSGRYVVFRSYSTLDSHYSGGGIYIYDRFATAVVPQSGIWTSPNQSGWGFFISAGTNMFVGAYLYDPSGRSTWYISGPAAMSGATFTAPMTVYSGGQTLGGPFKQNTQGVSPGNIS